MTAKAERDARYIRYVEGLRFYEGMMDRLSEKLKESARVANEDATTASALFNKWG